MIRKISIQKLEEDTLNEVIKVLNGGGIVVYPTETAYGLGCDAYNISAVKKIYEIKSRSEKLVLSVIVADKEMIDEIAIVNKKAEKLIDIFMPGPLIIALPKKKAIPDIVNPDRIAFRISSNPIVQQIISNLKKPLVSTSANLSGKPTPYSIENVLDSIQNKHIDLILDVGEIAKKPPSTIVDFVLEPSPQIVRIGEIPPEKILSRLEIPIDLWSRHIRI